MKLSKRHLMYAVLVILISSFLSLYKLPYYIYKPGSADSLAEIVKVEGAFKSEGDMHLVTVSGGQATPIQYIWAKLFPYHEVRSLEDVRPKGWTNEDYMHAQLQMMESSQQSSTVVAYEAANRDITIEFKGVYVVSVVEGMPAEGKLKMGDLIIGIDGHEIKEAQDLIDYIGGKSAGDVVHIDVKRDEELIQVDVVLEKFKDEDKVGMGIQLVTDREIEVNPKVNFTSGNIGGPSAGLMFALEIYDQLTEEDLTKGYQIVGTGELDYSGNVNRIGGIDKKVVAADREGCDIFFAPNEKGAKDSNYQVAKQTADEIGTKMKIVPVDTFKEALDYLQKLEPKQK